VSGPAAQQRSSPARLGLPGLTAALASGAKRRDQQGLEVHHFSDEVRSLNEPRVPLDVFFEISSLVPPKLLFWKSEFAQSVLVTTDDTTSFQPLGMPAAWKLPQSVDCVHVSEAPLKLASFQSMLSTNVVAATAFQPVISARVIELGFVDAGSLIRPPVAAAMAAANEE
jgi:hypothetical protein